MLYMFEIFLPKGEIKILYNFNFFHFASFMFAIIYCSNSVCFLFLISKLSDFAIL